MTKEYKCKTCKGKVTYEPQRIRGTLTFSQDKKINDNTPRTKIVYLKCESGHEHAYEVDDS